MNFSVLLRSPRAVLRKSHSLLIRNYDRCKRKLALKQLSRHTSRKIIIGAGGTRYEGWTPTELDILDMLNDRHWTSYFKPNSLDAILAEHVWEHLTHEESMTSALHCFKYLKPGGYLRVAVPDGFNPDPAYIEWVKPGGVGPGSDDHKVLYNHASFSKLFRSAGFDVSLYEYFDECGKFQSHPWSPEGGMIRRSKQYDRQFSERSQLGSNFQFTSIILDAIKPLG